MPDTAELQIQMRRGTASEWTSADPTLLDGEIGYETDTGFWKWGDGSTAWVSLTYDHQFGGSIVIANASPSLSLLETDAGVDQGYWRTEADGEALTSLILDDALANSYDYLNVERSGTGASVQVESLDLTAVDYIGLNVDSLVYGSGVAASPSEMIQSHNDGLFQISGGNSVTSGAALLMYGGAHTNTGDLHMLNDGVPWLSWDESGGVFTLKKGAGAGKTESLVISASGLVTVSGGIVMPAAATLFFDGGFDTHIREQSADVLTFTVGGGSSIQLTTTDVRFFSDVEIQATDILYFDGGNDTYITESAADTLELVTGGTVGLTVRADQDIWLEGGDWDATNQRFTAGDGNNGTPGLSVNSTAAGEPFIRLSRDGVPTVYMDYNNSGDVFRIDSDGSMEFEVGNVLALTLAASTLLATFAGAVTVQDNLIVSGTFTSEGIDDNATAERLQISDSGMSIGATTAASAYDFVRATSSGVLRIAGGNHSADGGQIWLYGSSHASLAGDAQFASSNQSFMYWDESAGILAFSTGSGSKSTALTLSANGLATFENSVVMQAGDKLYFDGGTHTYIEESTADTMRFVAGNVEPFRLVTTGARITGGLQYAERADHAFTPAATFGELWLRNDANQTLMFTDDADVDHEIAGTDVGGGGGESFTYTLQTGTSYTAVVGDWVVASNTGTVTIDLPSGHSADDSIMVTKSGASGTVTVDGDSSETINGATTYDLTAQWSSITLRSDGTNWIIV